jgi:hypothetical protein
MKTNTVTKLTAGVFALALFGISNSEAAHEGNQLVRLTHQAEDMAEDLRDEFKKHFKHSGSNRHLMSDIEGIEEDLEHIDKLAHHVHHESLLHVKRDIESVDKSVHHLTAVIEGVECGRYSGHIDGDTRHVKRLIASLNNTLHAMEEFVNARVHDRGHSGHGHGYGDSRSRESSWGQSSSRTQYGSGGDDIVSWIMRFAAR